MERIDAKAVKILLLFYVTVFLASVPEPRDTKPRANSFILCHYNDLAQIERGSIFGTHKRVELL